MMMMKDGGVVARELESTKSRFSLFFLNLTYLVYCSLECASTSVMLIHFHLDGQVIVFWFSSFFFFLFRLKWTIALMERMDASSKWKRKLSERE